MYLLSRTRKNGSGSVEMSWFIPTIGGASSTCDCRAGRRRRQRHLAAAAAPCTTTPSTAPETFTATPLVNQQFRWKALVQHYIHQVYIQFSFHEKQHHYRVAFTKFYVTLHQWQFMDVIDFDQICSTVKVSAMWKFRKSNWVHKMKSGKTEIGITTSIYQWLPPVGNQTCNADLH